MGSAISFPLFESHLALSHRTSTKRLMNTADSRRKNPHNNSSNSNTNSNNSNNNNNNASHDNSNHSVSTSHSISNNLAMDSMNGLREDRDQSISKTKIISTSNSLSHMYGSSDFSECELLLPSGVVLPVHRVIFHYFCCISSFNI